MTAPYRLSLVIRVDLAADLLPDNQIKFTKGCNPVLEAQINHVKRSTRKRRHTTQPSWDEKLILPLDVEHYSQIVTVSVWDKHRRYKNYLGELRLSLEDIFHNGAGFQLKTDVKWFKLHSNDDRHSFVTGSVLLGFELQVKTNKGRSRHTPEPLDNTPKIMVNGDVTTPPSWSTDEGSFVTLERLKKRAFDGWIESLLYQNAPQVAAVNDQGFYGEGLGSDVASLAYPKLQLGASDGTSFLEVLDSEAFAMTSTSQSKKKKEGPYELVDRKVYGVLYLEIVSCSDLPRIHNVTRTSYDVDPFVVVTFGKKTYRTLWKRHNLNPIFNERLVFEVLPFEAGFDIRFEVFDRDLISNHDRVASVLVPLTDITENCTALPSQPIPIDRTENSSNDDDVVHEVHKSRFKRKNVVTLSVADTLNFLTLHLDLQVANQKYATKYKPTLKIRARFETYDLLRRNFWKILLRQFHPDDDATYDHVALVSLLDVLGCTDSKKLAQSFFIQLNKVDEPLTQDEVVDCLEDYIKLPDHQEKIMVFDTCHLCNRKRLLKKEELDIVTHVAVCASKDWSIVNKLLVLLYITPQLARRKWVPRVVKKITYGKYKLGGRLANILVQDRTTGIILEEKMSVYVRLGIRLLYNTTDKASLKKVRKLLKLLSEKQGAKFDLPESTKDIASFIKFHGLDLSDCLIQDPVKFPTFNEFFYRKLRPGARPLELDDPKVVVSVADSRCVCFPTVNEATQLWIKGKNFTLARLFNGNFNNYENSALYNADQCSLAIFRLAPQDYHRFHCPVDGVIGPIKHIVGECYTVNPMAIRLELDVFGDNVRTIIPIELPQFGKVVMVAVGAMMVGLIILSVEEGEEVLRGDEIGYFKFGGSTVVLLMERDRFQFDLDLLANSHALIETLVRVGQSVGHAPDVAEVERKRLDFFQQLANYKMKVIRTLTGGDLSLAKELKDWESFNLLIIDDD